MIYEWFNQIFNHLCYIFNICNCANEQCWAPRAACSSASTSLWALHVFVFQLDQTLHRCKNQTGVSDVLSPKPAGQNTCLSMESKGKNVSVLSLTCQSYSSLGVAHTEPIASWFKLLYIFCLLTKGTDQSLFSLVMWHQFKICVFLLHRQTLYEKSIYAAVKYWIKKNILYVHCKCIRYI